MLEENSCWEKGNDVTDIHTCAFRVLPPMYHDVRIRFSKMGFSGSLLATQGLWSGVGKEVRHIMHYCTYTVIYEINAPGQSIFPNGGGRLIEIHLT